VILILKNTFLCLDIPSSQPLNLELLIDDIICADHWSELMTYSTLVVSGKSNASLPGAKILGKNYDSEKRSKMVARFLKVFMSLDCYEWNSLFMRHWYRQVKTKKI